MKTRKELCEALEVLGASAQVVESLARATAGSRARMRVEDTIAAAKAAAPILGYAPRILLLLELIGVGGPAGVTGMRGTRLLSPGAPEGCPADGAATRWDSWGAQRAAACAALVDLGRQEIESQGETWMGGPILDISPETFAAQRGELRGNRTLGFERTLAVQILCTLLNLECEKHSNFSFVLAEDGGVEVWANDMGLVARVTGTTEEWVACLNSTEAHLSAIVETSEVSEVAS